MTVLQSAIDTNSEDYKQNYRRNKALAEELRSRIFTEKSQSHLDAIQKHRERGRLQVIERIELLVDRDTPFLEMSQLAANGQYNDQFPGAGIVTGIGFVQGIETVIIANDPTVKGGTYIRETIKKHLRALEIALENRLPCIYIVESGGIFLPEQAQVFADRDHFGRIFYYQSRLSAENIPQVAIVMGSCTAGGAYIPAMSDEVIMVNKQSTLFLGGPSLVKAATGETVTAEELGGAMVHTSVSGVADYLADDEEHAIEICRNIFSGLPKPRRQELDKIETEDPLYPADELYGIIPTDVRKSIDVHEIIMRLVDGSKFEEFKANYGQTLVTGYARVYGYPVGIVASNGILFSESALKGTHFIELCNHRKIPLVFLHNITGFMVGKEYEHKGIAKDGAKMVHAVSNANVPKFTIIFGNSHGAGNYAMAGRAFNPTLLWMWPNSRISVMGGEQASGVLASIKTKPGEDKNDATQSKTKSLVEQFEEEGSAYYSTSRLWDDGILNPTDTRVVLAIGISMSLNKPFANPKVGVYRM
jgi:3-methylcrotonyl-CoA carboxylase beta subunit